MAPIRCCFDQTAVWHSDAARGPSTPSFNHLVRQRKQLVRHVQAERLGGLEVEHELELAGSYDRQFGRLLALQNAPNVDAGQAICIGDARAVAHETTGRGKLA